MRDTAAMPMATTQIQKDLVTRIALSLNVLSREKYRGLMADGSRYRLSSEKELLRVMVSGNCIHPDPAGNLKTACGNFAGIQEDFRFGALAVSLDFVSRMRLGQVLSEQKRLEESGEKCFIGEMLVARGVLSDRQRKLILHRQKMEQELEGTVAGLGADVKVYREKEVTIYVTGDELTAYAVKTQLFHNRFGLDDLKKILLDIGIIFGVGSDGTLTRFLKDAPVQGAPFEIAMGRKGVPARDAKLNYLFNREYLAPGALGKDGTTDVKSRGELPLVKKNEVIAEKVPARQGRDGINVFGNTIATAPPKAISIRCGKGVTLSGDRRTAYAAVDGYPKLNRDGVLSVSDVCVVEGECGRHHGSYPV